MRIALLFTYFFSVAVLKAQESPFIKDLNALRSILQKTPSYKSQLNGEKLDAYDRLYNRLAADTAGNVGGYDYFYKLSQLFFPLKDNHLGFYEVPDYTSFKNKQAIEEYVQSKAFNDFPRYQINIDSLRKLLAEKPADSIEGIYHYDKFYSVGLFKVGEKEYIGVVIDSDINLWQKGQVAMHLYETSPGRYKAIYAHPLFKNYILQNNEKFADQSLLNSNFYSSYTQAIYSKRLQAHNYINLPPNAPRFELQNINQDVQYLLVRSFQTSPATARQSKRFCDSIKNLLKAPNLVLDLRNNEGGAEKQTKQYLRLLKKYLRKGKLYVMLNNGTISQAEIFTLRLRKLKHVTTVGHTTRGMLAYGSNYGKREKLPGGKIEVYITDMKGRDEYLQYEDEGINPDIILNNDSGWIEQVIRIIGGNTK